MLRMDDRQVPIQNRKWIAVNGELRIERNSLLTGWQIRGTQEARPLRHGSCIHGGRGAPDSMRNVTNQQVPARDELCARLAVAQAFNTASKQGPRVNLIGEQPVNVVDELAF